MCVSILVYPHQKWIVIEFLGEPDTYPQFRTQVNTETGPSLENCDCKKLDGAIKMAEQEHGGQQLVKGHFYLWVPQASY